MDADSSLGSPQPHMQPGPFLNPREGLAGVTSGRPCVLCCVSALVPPLSETFVKLSLFFVEKLGTIDEQNYIHNLTLPESFLTAWPTLLIVESTGYERALEPASLASDFPAGFAAYQLCDFG